MGLNSVLIPDVGLTISPEAYSFLEKKVLEYKEKLNKNLFSLVYNTNKGIAISIVDSYEEKLFRQFKVNKLDVAIDSFLVDTLRGTKLHYMDNGPIGYSLKFNFPYLSGGCGGCSGGAGCCST